MPKGYPKSGRKAYVPRRRGATVAKPYGGGRYGNDAFIKIEAIEPLATDATANECFATMRVTPPSNAVGNTWLGNQAEFLAFRELYARYEVVGMKAETTLNARIVFTAANIAGGFAPRMPAIALFPSEDNNVSYPL